MRQIRADPEQQDLTQEEEKILAEAEGVLAGAARRRARRREAEKAVKRKEAARKAKEDTAHAGALVRRKTAEAAAAAAGSALPALLAAGAVLALVLALPIVLTALVEGVAGTGAASATYLDSDAAILAGEKAYRELEEKLKEKIGKIEEEYPGFDEYRYELCEIGHDPYELASLLSARHLYYDDVTKKELEDLLEAQYDLKLTQSEETRKIRETDPGTGEETVREVQVLVLTVTLTGRSIDEVAKEALSGDAYRLYAAYQETAGSRLDLFGKDGADSNYEFYYGDTDYGGIGKALSGTDAGRMYAVAQAQVGKPYVYGACHGEDYLSSDPKAFDCSSFVSWVIDHSIGHVGISDTNGLLYKCEKVPPDAARPGDLIFFQKTYNYPGASHVGIYLGDGLMIHAGSPVKVTETTSSYWQAHFLTYGRLKEEYRN